MKNKIKIYLNTEYDKDHLSMIFNEGYIQNKTLEDIISEIINNNSEKRYLRIIKNLRYEINLKGGFKVSQKISIPNSIPYEKIIQIKKPIQQFIRDYGEIYPFAKLKVIGNRGVYDNKT